MNLYKSKNNSVTAISLVGIVIAMIVLAYASVPLYDYFCKVTGFGGTPNVYSTKSIYSIDQTISVRLDSNVGSTLDWQFYPEQRIHEIKIGENKLINYVIENNANQPLSGTAVYNVSPTEAGKYFNKIECFCFEEQAFKPGEEVEMPVSFFIDSDILSNKYMKSIDELTLSYTMFIKK